MLQYLLTGLAGIAVGMVAMRVWLPRAPGDGPSPTAADPDVPVKISTAATGNHSRNLLIAAGVLFAAAIAAFAMRSNDSPSAPGLAAAASDKSPSQSLDDVDTMIGRLASRLEKEPNDGEGFRMLGWSYLMTNRPEQAIAPYQRALALLPGNALVHSGYGEALAGVAKGTVTPQAKAEFERAVQIDRNDPRARYFLALWQAQHGQQREALDKWIALANGGPADAPWQGDLRRQITAVSNELGMDVSDRLRGSETTVGGVSAPPIPGDAVTAAAALPAADRQAMVDQMVSGLADKLKSNPKDVDRWILLLRSRMVLHQADQAKADLDVARSALGSDATALARVNAAARELNVPGA